jgi:hypothetical protein
MDRDKLILEQIEMDLGRLAMQASAMGQPLLAYLVETAP